MTSFLSKFKTVSMLQSQEMSQCWCQKRVLSTILLIFVCIKSSKKIFFSQNFALTINNILGKRSKVFFIKSASTWLYTVFGKKTFLSKSCHTTFFRFYCEKATNKCLDPNFGYVWPNTMYFDILNTNWLHLVWAGFRKLLIFFNNLKLLIISIIWETTMNSFLNLSLVF